MKSSNPMTAHESASFLSFFTTGNFQPISTRQSNSLSVKKRKDQNNEIIKQKHHPSINELNKTNYFMSNQRDTTI